MCREDEKEASLSLFQIFLNCFYIIDPDSRRFLVDRINFINELMQYTAFNDASDFNKFLSNVLVRISELENLENENET